MTVLPGVHGHGVVLNLAGEGEDPRAIDVNSLVSPTRRPESWIRPGRFIRADITALPVRSAVAAEVVGTRLPMMSPADRVAVVREAARVLMVGGIVRLHASSGSGAIWLPLLAANRLASVSLVGAYATGVKGL